MLNTLFGVTGLIAFALTVQTADNHGSMHYKVKPQQAPISTPPTPEIPASGKSISQPGVKRAVVEPTPTEEAERKRTKEKKVKRAVSKPCASVGSAAKGVAGIGLSPCSN